MIPEHHTEVAKTASLGVAGGVFSWIMSLLQWYYSNIGAITSICINIAQLGGLIIMVYSIMILRRNWNNGKTKNDPLDEQ